MMAAPLTAAELRSTDYLDEARWICRRVPTLSFRIETRSDPRTRSPQTVYRIYRRGMGLVAERASPAALVAYLRKQLPPS